MIMSTKWIMVLIKERIISYSEIATIWIMYKIMVMVTIITMADQLRSMRYSDRNRILSENILEQNQMSVV